VEARSGERLVLQLAEGTSVRVTGRDHDGVAIHSASARRMDVTAERVPGGVRIRASVQRNHDGNGPDLVIQVPGRFDVQVDGDGSGVELRDVRGTFSGHTRGGGVAFIRAGGTVRMDAGGGGAYIQDSHLDGRLEMGGGGVMMARNRGNLDVVGAAATVHGTPDQARAWADRLRADAGAPSSRAGDVTWSANGDGSWTAAVAGSNVTCQGDNCVVSVDTAGGAGWSTDVQGNRRTWSRAAASADAGRRGAVASAWSGGAPAATARGAAARERGASAAARGAAVAAGSSDSRGAGSTWTVESRGSTRIAGTAKPLVISADGNGYAYATGDVAGRIASIEAMARYAPPEAAAQGIAQLALADGDARVERAAVDALAGLRDVARIEQLRRIAREHRNPEIRRRAEEALR
ncbi:MAG TPA: HEAT repeat domain-containing protein, partial [Longimicrobium sp.]|nr:HEAT repeat domain-containing protein [Longimicrobium sp.]